MNIIISPSSPLFILLPYQRDYLFDENRWKMGCWSRQTGKSFSTAAETVRDCHMRKTTWTTLSAGERQALEWMVKAKEWAEAFDLAVEDYQENRDSNETVLKSAQIIFSNGSRIIALPANPATARGYSTNITLDEFAFHEKPNEIWRAMYPSISNPLRGTYKIRIVSTPNGKGNKFYDLWSKDNGYSKHLIDIYEAIKRGLKVDAEELKRGLDDPEGWAQEFECQFLDSAAILLPYELIAGCEDLAATETIAPEYWNSSTQFPRFGGIDFGRKRNLSVGWFCERISDVRMTKEVLCMQNMSTPDQVAQLRPRIQKCQRVSIDYTGPGVGLGDYLVAEFGEYNPEQHRFGKIELCTMSSQLKVEVCSKTRMAFENRSWRIPVSREIREDLHSMHRVVTASGNTTYRAVMTDDSHADRFSALALCDRASAQEKFTGIHTVKGIRFGGFRRAA